MSYGKGITMKNKFLKTGIKLSMAFSFLLATGCAELYKRELQHTQENGPEFTKFLAKEYETLGDTEQAIMYDDCSATYYFRKALRAKEGCTVFPTTLDRWKIENDKLPELSLARERLMRALEYGAWKTSPKMAAHAQAYFDCWVEQQSEGWQKEDIANCRAEFYEAISDVELMLMGGLMNVFPSSMVFFDTSSAHINAEALRVIDEVATVAKSPGNTEHILLIGRTDRVGDATHNKHLAKHRATMVKKELVRRGVNPHRIAIKAVGEMPGPKVDAHNRRVDIIFLGYE